MRLSQLEYFIKVSECGSITRAAQELYLSQPSLTKSISNLEAEYGIQLLERTPKGIRVTTRGREFLEYAQNVVAATQELDNTFRGEGEGTARHRLYIASQQFDFLYDVVSQIYKEYCKDTIHIDLDETNRGSIIERVWNREVDIGLLVLTKEDTRNFRQELQEKNLEIHTLDISSAYVSMCGSSPLFGKPHISTAEASQYPHVVLDMEKGMRKELYMEQSEWYMDNGHVIFCNTVSACLYFMEAIGALLYTPKWVQGLLPEEKVYTTQLELTDGNPYPDVSRLVWIKRETESLNALEELFIRKIEEHIMEINK